MPSCNSIRAAALADWPCNETSGNLADSTGNGNTLTMNGTPDAYQADGPGAGYDKSIDFGSAWAVSAGQVLPASGDFSVSMWILPEATASDVPFSATAEASGGVMIKARDAGLLAPRAFVHSGASYNTVSTFEDAPTGEWSFLTLTRDGDLWGLDVNGVEDAEIGSVPVSMADVPVVLNSRSSSTSNSPMEGRIAAVTISSETDVHDELMAGPEPTYTSGASLSTAGVFSAGIWGNQQNGTLTYTCELRSSDGYVRESVSASSGTFSLTPNVGDSLWVKVENDGGADVGDDGAGYYKLATREATSYTEITSSDESLKLLLGMQDDAASTVVVNDVGPDATLEGGKTTADVSTTGPTDHLPKALAFDGVADFINADSQSDDATVSDDLTVAMWAKFDTFPTAATSHLAVCRINSNDNIALVYDDGTGDNQFGVRIDDGTNRYATIEDADTALGTDWHHVAVSWQSDSKSIALYIDGELQTVVTDTINARAASNGHLEFGRGSDGTGLFDGDIAQPAVYARALSADEILHLMNGPEPIYASGGSLQSDGLYGIGNWLNLDSPGIAYDVDLRSADGTVKETKTTDAGYFAATVEVGDQLWVKVSSDGGYASADDGNGYYRVTTVRATTLAELDNHQALAVHLRLQDDAATTVVVNEVGDNATLEGGGTALDNSVNGPCRGVEKALTLDGTADYVSLGSRSSGTEAITISLWMRGGGTSDPFQYGRTLLRRNASTSWNWYGDYGNPSVPLTGLSTPVSDWHHMAIVQDGTQATVYLNGEPIVTVTAAALVATAVNSAFGRWDAGAANYFEGDLADVRVYATDLDADEVAKLAVQPPRLSNVLESSYIHVV